MSNFSLSEGINKLREISRRAEEFDCEKKHKRALALNDLEEMKGTGISGAISFGAVLVFFLWVKQVIDLPIKPASILGERIADNYTSLGFGGTVLIFMICWSLVFAGVLLSLFLLRKTALIPLSPRALEIKQDTMRDYSSEAMDLVKQYEGAEGFIWRFAPHIADQGLLEQDTRNAMIDSFNKKEIAPLDYVNAVNDLITTLARANNVSGRDTWQAMCEAENK